jgi:hypothetical protein
MAAPEKQTAASMAPASVSVVDFFISNVPLFARLPAAHAAVAELA